MTPDNLKGLSYQEKLEVAARFSGVASSVYDGIYATESNRGKNMRSPAGALGHFQFMPQTSATWSKRLGRQLDPFDFDDALTMAAYQMKENMRATGDLPDALRMYNAGTNRARWDNPETASYVGKVLGSHTPEHNAGVAAQPVSFNADFILTDPQDLVYGRHAVSSPGKSDKAPQPTQKQLDAAAVGGAQPVLVDLGDGQAQKAATDAKADRQLTGAFDLGRGSFGDKLAAGVQENASMALYRHFDRQINGGDYDPAFAKWKLANVDQMRVDGVDQDGFTALANAKSRSEYDVILRQRGERASITKGAQYKGVEALTYGLAGGLLDPVGFGATMGVGAGFNGAGVGGRSLMAAGRLKTGLLAYASEGAVANAAFTGLLQVSGEKATVNDYLISATAGAMFGTAFGGIDFAQSSAALNKVRGGLAEHTARSIDEAMVELGPDAAPQDIIRRANEKQASSAVRSFEDAMYAESEHTFMPRDAADVLLDPKAQKVAAKENGTQNVGDPVERNVLNEIIANAKNIDASIPVDKATLGSWTSWLPGAESAGLALLKSDNAVARAVSKALLESTSGAAGRRNNAAMVKHINEQRYMQSLHGWDELANEYIMSEGHGLIPDQITQRGLREFNRKVFYEIEARRQGGTRDENPLVLAAADKYEGAMQLIADAQRGAKTAGHLRLPMNSRGYAPRSINVKTVVEMAKTNKPGYEAVVQMLAKQLSDQGMNNKFDPNFALKVARRYLQRAKDKYAGQGSIPMMLHDADATATLREAIKAMDTGLQPADIDKLLGRFSRGGGQWTKKRLDLDLFAEIPDGKGGKILLGDIFEQDLGVLYRRQARRVAGEVSLARHNILGLKGVESVRDAIKETGGSVDDLRHFDHVMSEFMGFPIGEAGSKRRPFIEDVLTATAAARLGMAVFPQMGEYGNALSTLGVSRVFQAIVEVPRMIKDIRDFKAGKVSNNPILRDFDRIAFVGGDDYQSGLFSTVLDDSFEMYGDHHVSAFGRVARAGARAQYILSFHRKVTAFQTRGLAEQLLKKAFVMLREGRNDVDLRDIGLDAAWQASVRENLDQVAKFDAKGNLTELNLYDHMKGDDILTLQTALHRGAGQMVQRTYIGETGLWVSDSFLKMLYQFRRHGITALEKQTARDLANKGAVGVFAGLLTAWAFAIPIHAARVELRSLGKSEDERKDFLNKQLNPATLALASLNYATKSGMLTDVTNIGVGVAAGWNDTAADMYSAMSGGGRAGARSFIGGEIAPAAGVVNDLAKGLSGNPEKLLKLIPGANLIYVQPLVNAIGSAEGSN